LRKSILLLTLITLLFSGALNAQAHKKKSRHKHNKPSAALTNPSLATAVAPAVFKVKFETTKGTFVVQVVKEWAPNGANRFFNLIKMGYYNDVAFFRVVSGFMAQFGINGDPAASKVWQEAKIDDDPVTQSNKRGFLTFATAGPHTRTTQLFINYNDKNARLDRMGFAPFGKVIEGMDVVDALHNGYGEGAPRGRGPAQDRIQNEGNKYLKKDFPKLDYIQKATVVR
jgi:peptidyl-prolyl cis-trans isomerase A (cyclophilin A)